MIADMSTTCKTFAILLATLFSAVAVYGQEPRDEETPEAADSKEQQIEQMMEQTPSQYEGAHISSMTTSYDFGDVRRDGGINHAGNVQLDTGLQGRGLVGELPQPSYPGNESGKVVIRVTIDKSGQVTNAVYEPKGSTTSNQAMVNAAIAAARKARFTESKSFVEGGTITYKFNLK